MVLICLSLITNDFEHFLYAYLSSVYDDSDDKESSCSAGDPGPIPGLGRSSGEGNGNLVQYSRLENPMDRETSKGLQRAGND